MPAEDDTELKAGPTAAVNNPEDVEEKNPQVFLPAKRPQAPVSVEEQELRLKNNAATIKR